MADLIAQGADIQQRWRRKLPVDQSVVLGRQAQWSVGWDDRVSREHLRLIWNGKLLQVTQLPHARNPVFWRGQTAPNFELRPGDHFVLGSTTISLADDDVQASLDVPQPLREQTFSAQYLKRMRFRNADQRIENLSRLPELIAGATSDSELYVRLVNVLLAGVTTADAIAIVELQPAGADDREVRILHWDQRRLTSGRFQPSQRLIQEAVVRGESVLHVWNILGASQVFTQAENCDWAFCTPVPGEACRGWGIYLTGRFISDGPLPDAVDSDALLSAAREPEAKFSAAPLLNTPADPTDLRDDLKFTEIAASTLGSLRQLRALDRRQAGLRQFFSPLVLEALANDDPDLVLAPRETPVSVLFCDLRGFSLQSDMAAHDLMGLLHRVSRALGVMTRQILAHGGVVGDFQGDAAMGFWGWPMSMPDAALRACQAALAIRAEFDAGRRQSAVSPSEQGVRKSPATDHEITDFRVGIGVATGRAVAGKIGTADHVKVTVFGPVANRASRLESMTRHFDSAILLDQNTAAQVRDTLLAETSFGGPTCIRRLARVRPFGMEQAVDVHELLSAHDLRIMPPGAVEDYEASLVAFERGDWSQAIQSLGSSDQADGASRVLQKFIQQHNGRPPAAWDGIIPFTTK